MNGVVSINAESTFKQWGELWYRRKKLDFSYSYGLTALNHLKNINDFIGDIPIVEIRRMDIDNFIISYAEINPHTKKPTAKSTLKDMRNIAAAVFDFACDYEILQDNPARGRKIPKKAPRKDRRPLSSLEQQWILSMEHRMKFCAMLMMLCGPRLGEVIPLKWNDIDFESHILYINKSVEKRGNQYFIKPNTKNNKCRCVKIPSMLVKLAMNEKQKAIGEFVITQINGEMHTPSSFTSAWRSYIREMNFKYGIKDASIKSKYDPKGVPFTIEKITPHMLRHTYATLLFSSGVDILSASKLLGHSDVKTTLQIYTHLEESKYLQSIDKFEDYLAQNFLNKAGLDRNEASFGT